MIFLGQLQQDHFSDLTDEVMINFYLVFLDFLKMIILVPWEYYHNYIQSSCLREYEPK